MATLGDLSEELAAAVETASKSVVSVDARRGRAGSGIVWAENLVLTADHVLERDQDVTIGFNGTQLKATVAGRDHGSDLAVLRTEGLKATVASRAGNGDLKVGHLVVAVGRPSELRATLGMVSSLESRIRGWRGGDLDQVIRTTAPMYSGFSGGPLIDTSGRTVGINSWYFGQGDARAIPAAAADRVVQKLVADGRVKRPYLGIATQPVSLPQALGEQLRQESGLLVVAVEPGSAAESAGVLLGDTIVSLDSNGITGMRELFRSLRKLEVGSKHELKVVRAGETRTIAITVGEASD
jgi:S1-C subfamily serine protease